MALGPQGKAGPVFTKSPIESGKSSKAEAPAGESKRGKQPGGTRANSTKPN